MINKFKGELKCHRCENCLGYGCIGQLPGLGGVFESQNFQLNCQAWAKYKAAAVSENEDKFNSIKVDVSKLRCGPVTGAVENIGFANEKDFYLPYLKNAFDSGIGLCVGDGCPDEKLINGIDAVKKIGTKAAFFIKPYPDAKLEERVSWIKPYAEYIGIDMKSYFSKCELNVEIDEMNILNASLTAMTRAMNKLNVKPEYCLVDGNKMPKDMIGESVVKGDAKSLSIAAASILAKTYRDDLMTRLDAEYPVYDWKNNKGYPAPKHIAAVMQHGFSPYHRRSFHLKNQLSLDFGE